MKRKIIIKKYRKKIIRKKNKYYKKGKYHINKFCKNIVKLIKIIIIIGISFLYYKINLYNEEYKYCFECIKNIDNLDKKCYECPNEVIFKDKYIVSTDNTLYELIKHNKSISRFSDGEFAIIYGHGINFQEYNKILSQRLFEVLNSNEKNLLVGIDYTYQQKKLNSYVDFEYNFWTRWMKSNKFRLLKILKRKKYYSSDISRFYLKYKDKSGVPKFIKKFRTLWEGRDILIIEGEKSRIGIGNDLFKDTKSIKRILCPAKHAFRVYDKILNSTLKIDKNYLILIALGPTASVLAYDLTKYGYQAIDLGHTDIQYEFYLRNATKNINIPNKFVNEYNGGINVGNINDNNYFNQIIEKILY